MRSATLCVVAFLGFVLTPAQSEDLLGDLRAEARKEITEAARVEVQTVSEAGRGLLRGHTVAATSVRLTTGIADYELDYVCLRGEDGDRRPVGQPLAELGMPGPVAANWYLGGFLDVLSGGTGLAQVPARIAPLELPAGQAGASILWAAPAGTVHARFLTMSFDPFLYLVLDLPEGPDLEVKLLCYPNSFQLPRDRWLTTSLRDIHHRRDLREELAAEESSWVVYSDRAADPLLPPTTGPCGLVLLPTQAINVVLEMGRPERPDWPAVQNYGVMTTIIPRAGQRRIAIALIDFVPVTWRQARDQMQQDVARVQSRLRELLRDM